MSKTFRWAEIGHPIFKERFECLSQYLNEQGFKNTFEPFDVELDHFEEVLAKCKSEFDSVRVGSPFGQVALTYFTHLPALMVLMKGCDTLFKRNGTWWPDNLALKALQTLVANLQTDLDFSGAVLMVGAGAAARASVAAALKMGFCKINVTDQFEERGIAFVEELKRHYFNVHFHFTPPSALTSLPGVHSFVINSTPLVESNEVLQQLYYFNFMQSGGLVVDYTMMPLETPLLKEARDVGGITVNGAMIASYIDQVWVEEYLGLSFDREAYHKRLVEHLGSLAPAQSRSSIHD